jgi:hypothetical protein
VLDGCPSWPGSDAANRVSPLTVTVAPERVELSALCQHLLRERQSVQQPVKVTLRLLGTAWSASATMGRPVWQIRLVRHLVTGMTSVCS